MDDQSTIKAINSLSRNFPYAAAVLIYIHIERLLKNYILENRKSGGVFDCEIKVFAHRNKLSVKDFSNHNKDDFIKDFLNNIELGKLEYIFDICDKEISKRRNNLMHSNKYISFERMKSYGKRSEINRKSLVEAKSDLKFIQSLIRKK